MRSAIILLLLLLASIVHSQRKDVILSQHLRKVFKEFKSILEAQPERYIHMSKESLQLELGWAEKALLTDLSPIVVYKIFARVVAGLKDGHSNVSMSKFWMKNIRKQRGVLPLEVHLNNKDELFLLKKYADKYELIERT